MAHACATRLGLGSPLGGVPLQQLGPIKIRTECRIDRRCQRTDRHFGATWNQAADDCVKIRT